MSEARNGYEKTLEYRQRILTDSDLSDASKIGILSELCLELENKIDLLTIENCRLINGEDKIVIIPHNRIEKLAFEILKEREKL